MALLAAVNYESALLHGNIAEVSEANTEIQVGRGFRGSRGLVFKYLRTENGNTDSWAEKRYRAVTNWGTEVWIKFSILMPASFPIHTSADHMKFLQIWFSTDNGATNGDPANDLAVTVELCPNSYSLSGSQVTPSTPPGLWGYLSSAGGVGEAREPNDENTLQIIEPAIRVADLGQRVNYKIRIKAAEAASRFELYRDGTLVSRTVEASNYSFLTAAMGADVFNAVYILGYDNRGLLAELVVDDFEIHSTDPDPVAIQLGVNAGFVTTMPTADPAGIGATADGAAAAVRDISPAYSSRLVSLGWYCSSVSEEANYDAALLIDATARDEPNARLAVTTAAKGTTAGWKSTPLEVRLLPTTPYWIGIQPDVTPTDTQVDVVSASGNWATLAGVGAIPSPWGTSASKSSGLVGAFVGLVVPHIPPKIHHARAS